MKLADAVRAARAVKVNDARRFAQHVVPEVVRPARIIWNQAIGAIFILFGLLFASYAVKYFKALHSSEGNPVALAFSAFMTAVMLFFGISSFAKARRLGRRL